MGPNQNSLTWDPPTTRICTPYEGVKWSYRRPCYWHLRFLWDIHGDIIILLSHPFLYFLVFLSIIAFLWNPDTKSQHPRVLISARWAGRWKSWKELALLCMFSYHILSLIFHIVCFRSVGEEEGMRKRERAACSWMCVSDLISAESFIALILYEKTTHTDAFEKDNKAACRKNSCWLCTANVCMHVCAFHLKSAVSESKHWASCQEKPNSSEKRLSQLGECRPSPCACPPACPLRCYPFICMIYRQ